MGAGNIVRPEATFVKSPTWADGRPFMKTLLGATMTLASGGQKVSLQTGYPKTGLRTSVPAALGLPLANTVETMGAMMFGG